MQSSTLSLIQTYGAVPPGQNETYSIYYHNLSAYQKWLANISYFLASAVHWKQRSCLRTSQFGNETPDLRDAGEGWLQLGVDRCTWNQITNMSSDQLLYSFSCLCYIFVYMLLYFHHFHTKIEIEQKAACRGDATAGHTHLSTFVRRTTKPRLRRKQPAVDAMTKAPQETHING